MGPLSLSIFMESGELRILPRADNPEQLSPNKLTALGEQVVY